MKIAKSYSVRAIALTALIAISGAVPLCAQGSAESPADLVRAVVKNEVNANSSDAKFMFRDRKQTLRGSQTRLVVETKEATAGMLVAIDDKPLTPQQLQSEEARLAALANNPEELRKRQKAEKDDAHRTLRIVKALPDAFVYEFDGTEPARPGLGNPGDELVRLKFRPNPSYEPPSRTEQVLTGMQGYVLIDANQHRIARIDGTLFKDVSFGWGILGRLDKGGRFLVEQGCVANGNWDVTRMNLSFTGRELLFKGINIKSDEVLSDFRSAPANLSFAEGVELLKKESTQLAQNHGEKDATKIDPR